MEFIGYFSNVFIFENLLILVLGTIGGLLMVLLGGLLIHGMFPGPNLFQLMSFYFSIQHLLLQFHHNVKI